MVATKLIKSGEQIVRPNYPAQLSKLNDLVKIKLVEHLW